MSNRFDLEQQILDCWKIIDDLQKDVPPVPNLILAQYYDHKFNKLWRTFEDMVYNKEFAQDDTNAVHS